MRSSLSNTLVTIQRVRLTKLGFPAPCAPILGISQSEPYTLFKNFSGSHGTGNERFRNTTSCRLSKNTCGNRKLWNLQEISPRSIKQMSMYSSCRMILTMFSEHLTREKPSRRRLGTREKKRGWSSLTTKISVSMSCSMKVWSLTAPSRVPNNKPHLIPTLLNSS